MVRWTAEGEALSYLQRISQRELNDSSRASFTGSTLLVIMCTHFVTLSLEMVTLQYSIFTSQNCSLTKHGFIGAFNMGVIMLENSR